MKAKQRSITISIIVTMVVGAAAAFPVAANAAPAVSSDGVTVSGTARLSPEVARTVRGVGAEAQRKALTAYWTPSRMRSAHADTELPSQRAAAMVPLAGPSAGAATTPQGAAEEIAAYAPAVAPKAVVSGGMTRADRPGYPIGHPTARTNGKAFFTAFGLNFACSAAIVNTEGKSEVWTAGHCVTAGGSFVSNWIFVPNYDNGAAPFGVWPAFALYTTAAFAANNGDGANDVGGAVLFRNNGLRIADYLGAQGIAWNQPASGNFVVSFAYTDECCLFREQGFTSDAGGGSIYMPNSLPYGTPAGGPWLIGFNGSFGIINGQNQSKFVGLPQFWLSPYYGIQVASVYNAVRGIST